MGNEKAFPSGEGAEFARRMRSSSTDLHRAVFFDRDGTLNVDVHYLYRPEDFQWTPGAVEAIKYCNDHGYLVIVITNQSGVARGYYTEADVHRLHDWMNADLEKHGAHIDAFYYCPHHVDGKVPEYTKRCDCRKPSPKMVNEACRDWAIDKRQSFFVGDKLLDMECAANAGVIGIQYAGGSVYDMLVNACEAQKVEPEQINIVFAADNNYAQHTAVAMASILMNAAHPNRIQFYLINDGIDTINKDKLIETVESLKGTVHFVDIDEAKLDGCYVSGQLSRATYFRLCIADLLPDTVKRIIYLDCDLLVLDNIETLWDIDMHHMPIAATMDLGIMASHRSRKQKLDCVGIPLEEPYFNAGVLMMDLIQWREKQYSSCALSLALSQAYPHHDQDVLNKIFMERWEEIPLRWDIIPPVFNMFLKIVFKSGLRQKAIEARKKPAIIHYAGGYKPWEYTLHPGFNDGYYKYLYHTAFRTAVMPQPDRRKKHRSILRQMLRLRMGDIWQRIFDKR